MEIVLVMSVSPLFLFCVRIIEFECYCFGKSSDTNLYENELLKVYNSTLTKCTHLIVKFRLEHTKCIAVLFVKVQSTCQNTKPGHKLKVKRETNKLSKSIDPYACAIKTKHQFFDTWLTVGQIPREISHHCYFFMEEGGDIT